MIDLLLYFLLGLAGITIALNFLRQIFKRKNNLGIEGKLIWVDKGRGTKPFFNRAYEVLGKPDLMYHVRDGVLAVEYKSRQGQVYESDVVQAKCAALAARGDNYKVVRILVKTATQEKYINLPRSDKELFQEIKSYVTLTRKSKNGIKMKAWPNQAKCKSCAYKNQCDYAHR